MQLSHKLSIISATLLLGQNIYAQDYVRFNVLQYNENDSRIAVTAPSLEVNKDFGTDYTLNVSLVGDTVSGGTPIYVDTASGATAYKGKSANAQVSDIKLQNVEMEEARSFGSIALTQRLANRDEISYGFSKSYESDYDANTLSLGFLKWADENKNSSFDVGLAYSFNNILIKDCTLNSECDVQSGASQKETSTQLNAELGYTQILNIESLIKIGLFYSTEDGYLSNPYYTVVRNNNGTTADVVAERRPDTRNSYGINLKYIRSFTESLTSHFKYKYYTDSWDINSHTVDIQNYYELNETFTFGLGLRFYNQSEANFYNKSDNFFTNEQYASHDERLNSFNTTTLKTSVDIKANDDFSYNIGASIYDQSTGLQATTFSLGLKYNF